jgi:hypothetical protein
LGAKGETLYNYEFGLSLCKIVRSSVILLLPLSIPSGIILKLANQSTTENCENRNDPDLVQAFLKKWWDGMVHFLHGINSILY